MFSVQSHSHARKTKRPRLCFFSPQSLIIISKMLTPPQRNTHFQIFRSPSSGDQLIWLDKHQRASTVTLPVTRLRIVLSAPTHESNPAKTHTSATLFIAPHASVPTGHSLLRQLWCLDVRIIKNYPLRNFLLLLIHCWLIHKYNVDFHSSVVPFPVIYAHSHNSHI